MREHFTPNDADVQELANAIWDDCERQAEAHGIEDADDLAILHEGCHVEAVARIAMSKHFPGDAATTATMMAALELIIDSRCARDRILHRDES